MNVQTINCEIKAGDIVCVTRIASMRQNEIMTDEFIGELTEDIVVNKHIQVTGSNLKTSSVFTVHVSYTCMLVKTKNSTYLIQKLPKEYRSHKPVT